MLLREQVILLSGVGEGLGRDTALLFAGEGADLVLTARKPDIIERVAEEVRALGRRCTTQVCDIEKPADCEQTVAAAVAAHGRIDGLINIAYRPAWPNLTPLLDTAADLSDWRGCFDVNVWGTLQMTRSVALHMAERRAGCIVMINTMTAEKVYEGSEAYSGSKIALQRMTRSIAMELGPLGIRVNSMHPGYMWGPQVEKVLSARAAEKGTTLEHESEQVSAGAALRYIPPTEEYARVLLFLVSPLSAAVTGQSLHVNAGLYLH